MLPFILSFQPYIYKVVAPTKRDCRQITFVTLCGFCPISTKPSTHLVSTDNIKMDTIPTKIKWKIIFTLYFKFWRHIRLMLICKIEPPDLLILVIFIIFYISRYNFSQIFRTSFNIIWKKHFCRDFFNGFTQTPQPLNGQNLLSVTKGFCPCSLMIIIILMIGQFQKNPDKRGWGYTFLTPPPPPLALFSFLLYNWKSQTKQITHGYSTKL